jgi:RNA polymerase sigma-70 factor, ECF subfamily
MLFPLAAGRGNRPRRLHSSNSMSDTPSREQLFSQYQEISSTYQPMLLRVARLFCNAAEDRADLCQEMLINIWLALPKFRGESKLSTWVYRIALNSAITHQRKSVRNTIALEQAGQLLAEAEQHLQQTEEYRLMMRQVEQLPAFDKAIVLLYLEQLSYEEIAGVMGLTVTNVGSKISRIKERLRRQLSATIKEQ